MTPWNLNVDLSDIDIRHLRTWDELENNDESNQSRLDAFLDSWLTWDRLEMLLSNQHRLELINQINDSVSWDILSILSLSNQTKLQNQRDNAADLIRMADLFKKLLSDASIIRKSEWKLRVKSEELERELKLLWIKFSELEESSKKDSERYELLKSEYEEIISKLTNELETEREINSGLIEEDVVSKLNADKIQETYKNRLKLKKTVSLKEFLDSKEWLELVKNRVLEQTSVDKKRILTLEKKVERLASRVIDVEDTNRIYRMLNDQLNTEFDKLTKFSEELVASSPTSKDMQELKEKISSLIIEKSELVLRLWVPDKDIWDRVGVVEGSVEKMRLEMKEMKRIHEEELKAKDEEIAKIRSANNIWVSPHIKKQAHKIYNEDKK